MEILKRIEYIIDLYYNKKKSIAIAESCTGGFICHMITNISGSSKIFDRGVICYSNQAKKDILNINEEILVKYGAVSEIVANQLSNNIRTLSNVDVGLGITGIAGPTGGTPLKPVGLVYIGFSSIEKTIIKKYIIKANRINFKEKVLEKVLILLEDFIEKRI
ncbi:MAG: CinA family protein [Candidatus Lokiarchaeota archaeon]|nr:CinA family protein [Candidatus Lokiarchaeota archaeon]